MKVYTTQRLSKHCLRFCDPSCPVLVVTSVSVLLLPPSLPRGSSGQGLRCERDPTGRLGDVEAACSLEGTLTQSGSETDVLTAGGIAGGILCVDDPEQASVNTAEGDSPSLQDPFG